MFLRTLLVVVSLSILSAHAGAVEVYFNGTRVTGLKSQSFDNCSVRFDASGNVHVTAKGYKVKRLTEPGKGGAPPKATSPKQYFIYSEARRPGYAQYDVDVYINGARVRRIRSAEGQVVEEISDKIQPGRNAIHFAATKNLGGKPRRSTLDSDFIKIIIGIGKKEGGAVTITSPVASFKATASTTNNFGRQQSITVD